MIDLPRMGRRRVVLGRLRPDRRHRRDALGPLPDLPIVGIPALMADDLPALGVQHHRGWSAKHPAHRFLDDEAPAPPADDIAVEDRPDHLETEDLFQVESFGQLSMEVLGLPGLALELGPNYS